jgi:D-psicose/D-tagatose/L-ribulose 3-epimerase
MRLAVSNIAWDPHDDGAVFALLRLLGVEGIEVAPTKIWPDWSGVTARSGRQYAASLANEGFCIPSLQSIVYGLPNLMLFGDNNAQKALVEHITLVADLASAMGAKKLIFGAPKNRLRGSLNVEDAFRKATQLFWDIADICYDRGTCFCIEPNPKQYGCDFITNTNDAIRLVRDVCHPGFGLHMDSAAITLAGEDIEQSILRAGKAICHYHASEPMLSDFSSVQVKHSAAGISLKGIGYQGWIAIEMIMSSNPPEAIRRAVAVVCEAYQL